jgi:spore coat polysaccharide biosynthesis protein SpsF
MTKHRERARVVAIVQARMGSTRLPGKVLLDIAGVPLLARLTSRLARARLVDQIVIATSVEPANDPIASFCRNNDLACFRGSEDDVLDRFCRAARAYAADVVVRITADCPLIDPGVVDDVVLSLLESPGVEYASNVLPRRTFPRGLDTEAFHIELLERLGREEQNPAYRQHVTETVFQHPERFRIHNLESAVDYSNHRWTVDTDEDLRLVCQVYQGISPLPFTWRDVIRFLESRPHVAALNRHIRQKAPF